MLYKELTKQLIVYGLGKYDPNKFKKIINSKFVKPTGGLWTSPINSSYGWKEWCESENYGDLSSNFLINFKGNCLQIDSLEDLKNLTLTVDNDYDIFSNRFIDFEKCLNDGIDAIWLTETGQNETRWSIPNLYGWDCECILILNADKLKEEYKK